MRIESRYTSQRQKWVQEHKTAANSVSMNYRQKTKKLKNLKAASKTKTNMKNIIRGFIFCALWYLSIIAGFFLLVCPILPLIIISPKYYRKWSDIIFGMWEPFPVAMMEVCFGIRTVLSGDKINPFECSLFIMNHRTRVDWNFLWLGLFHCCQPNAHNMKYILKAPIMHVPGPGWVMQTCSFVFIHRNWSKDKPLLNKLLDYLNDSDNFYQVLLFPEGTDLTENTIQNSHKYADEHNLDRYYNVLHPRTTGFTFLVSKMKSGGQLKAIYDVTVAYPKTMPHTEVDIFRGKFPEEVHFHFKRYSSYNIPYEEEGLKSWLNNVWSEKEKKLQKFYATGSFTNFEENGMSFNMCSDQEIDFGKMSMKNGIIKYDLNDVRNLDENQTLRKEIDVSSTSDMADTEKFVKRKISYGGEKVISVYETESCTYSQNHVNCEEVYRSKNYRPSHLLYLVLIFWITFIILTVYLLFCNIYIQIWVLIHSLLFIALSFVSNGFHQIAASFYFYRYEKKPLLVKKSE